MKNVPMWAFVASTIINIFPTLTLWTLAAYLSLKSEHRPAKSNRNLQVGIGLFAALSAIGTVIQALVAAHLVG